MTEHFLMAWAGASESAFGPKIYATLGFTLVWRKSSTKGKDLIGRMEFTSSSVHPKVGASWEGFVIEQLLRNEPHDEAFSGARTRARRSIWSCAAEAGDSPSSANGPTNRVWLPPFEPPLKSGKMIVDKSDVSPVIHLMICLYYRWSLRQVGVQWIVLKSKHKRERVVHKTSDLSGVFERDNILIWDGNITDYCC